MARTSDLWETGSGGTYIQTIGSPSGYDLLINGANHYLNFNSVVGSSGYGIRDNNGVIEVKSSGGAWAAISTISQNVAAILLIVDGGGSAITTGVKADLEIPFNCTIQRATLLADTTGSIVVDIWKDIYANYPPTVADTITASALPTISSSNKYQDSTLTGWTTTINAGDTLRFNVQSASTITRICLSLKVLKT